MEIVALAGLNEMNSKGLLALVESYKRLRFPGSSNTESDADKELERRKMALAKEAEKAFIIRPIDMDEVLKRDIKNPHYQKLAGRAMVEREREKLKQLQRQKRAAAEKAAHVQKYKVVKP